jgi:hypothetical protein
MQPHDVATAYASAKVAAHIIGRATIIAFLEIAVMVERRFDEKGSSAMARIRLSWSGVNEGASYFIPRAGRRSLSRSICSQLSPQWRVVVRIVYKVPSTFTTVFRILIDYLEGGDTLDQFLEQYPTVSHELAIAAIEEARSIILQSP